MLLALIIASAGWLVFVNRVRVIGIGYVVAEESIVSSQFEGRITALYVACNDRLKAGDPVGVVEDQLCNGKYREELTEMEAQ